VTNNHSAKTLGGLFVVIDGPDGVGKSTQIENVKRQLQGLGYHVTASREPGGTSIGETVRRLVKDNKNLPPWCELHLIQGARIDHINALIIPALQRNEIVLLDRFTPSTLVYQGVVRGIGVDEVASIIHRSSPNIEPDVTFILDAQTPQTGFEFSSGDSFEHQGMPIWRTVRQAYLELATRFGWTVVTADRPKDLVTENLVKLIADRLNFRTLSAHESAVH
jgi:dTMP kinase